MAFRDITNTTGAPRRSSRPPKLRMPSYLLPPRLGSTQAPVPFEQLPPASPSSLPHRTRGLSPYTYQSPFGPSPFARSLSTNSLVDPMSGVEMGRAPSFSGSIPTSPFTPNNGPIQFQRPPIHTPRSATSGPSTPWADDGCPWAPARPPAADHGRPLRPLPWRTGDEAFGASRSYDPAPLAAGPFGPLF
eukprot:TRINITY_DN6948_c0_g1_i1.p1 TRINITY_DN6948_c0_g1~~TRINITY_DN6948_c0_g1_i1.p1  ORF type:complete len:196 (-),score=29.24 TRINITY_DN6948_c0_g1_i1:431-997(-)